MADKQGTQLYALNMSRRVCRSYIRMHDAAQVDFGLPPLMGMAAAVYVTLDNDQYVYFMGGARLEAASNQVTILNVQTNTSTTGPPMINMRFGADATVVRTGQDTTIVVCGGRCPCARAYTFKPTNIGTQSRLLVKPLANCEQLTVGADAWIALPPLPVPVTYHTMATIDNDVYVIGGLNRITHDTCSNASARVFQLKLGMVGVDWHK